MLLWCAVVVGAQLSDLPSLALDTLAPAARAQIEQAWARARANPTDAASVGELGMVLHAYEQYASAEAAYRRARGLDPRSFQWAYGLGVIQAQTGKHADAVQSLRASVDLDPKYVPARLKLAEELLAIGDMQAAVSIYTQLLGEQPDLAAAHYGLGRIKTAARQTSAAIEHYRKACDLFPQFGAAHYALALAYRDAGDLAAAQQQLAAYETDKRRWPPVDDPALDRVRQLNQGARQHLAEGVQLGQTGHIEQAIQEHERALAIDPTLEQAHLNLISLYGQLGDWTNAEKHYRAAVAINSNLAEAHYNYGVLLVKQNRLREAADAFRQALGVNPFFAAAYNNLGQMLEQEGRVADAEQQYRNAVANDPQNRLARFNLGRMLVAQKRYGDAIAEFTRILQPDDGDTPRFMFALAAAYVRAGKLEDGRRYATQAKQRAEALGQRELAAAIERDLRQLEARRP